MIPAIETASAAAVLLIAAVLLVARTPEASAALFASAAVPQAALAVTLAALAGRPELYLDAGAILLIKGFWAPRLLRRAARHGGEVYGLAAHRSATLLFVGAALVTLLCLRLGAAILPTDPPALGLALAAMFTGFGVAALRPELWSQASGILVGEAGVIIAALVLVAGLPLLGEALALAEIVLLTAVLGFVSVRVRSTHGAADARLLRGLRG